MFIPGSRAVSVSEKSMIIAHQYNAVGIVFLALDVLLQILLGQGTLRPDLIESASELATTGTCNS
jgi:hypothetical protein